MGVEAEAIDLGDFAPDEDMSQGGCLRFRPLVGRGGSGEEAGSMGVDWTVVRDDAVAGVRGLRDRVGFLAVGVLGLA